MRAALIAAIVAHASACGGEPTLVIDLRTTGDGAAPRTGVALPRPPRDAELDALVDELVEKYWRAFPTAATYAGVHTYDDRLEDMSADAVTGRLAIFKGYRDRLKTIPTASLSTDRSVDRDLLLVALEWLIAETEVLEAWKKDPAIYNDLAAFSVFALLLRRSAPEAERARAVISRLRRFEGLFDAARENLGEDVSPLALETAVRDAEGTVSFLRSSVPAFLATATKENGELTAEGIKAAEAAATAVEGYVTFLTDDLGPRARGHYVLGRKLYVLKSHHHNAVNLAPAVIAARGLMEVRRLQAEMRKVAAGLAPGRTLEEALAAAASDHPKRDELVSTYATRLDELRAFVAEKKLLTLPATGDRIEVIETPEFARSMLFAAVFAPGPFETDDLTTYYVVTPIDRSRTPEEQAAQLREHSLAAIDVISIHEAYPGHHIQLLLARAEPSKVRKVFSNSVFIEGWAHYAEQMVVESGFHASAKLRLFMLKEALLRACRMHLDPLVHTNKRTYEEARAFYAEECYQSDVTAEMEARRVALEPATVYVYTLGKLQILALREERKRKLGPTYRLADFHDALLAHGSIPLPLLAERYLDMTPGALEARIAAEVAPEPPR